MNGYSLPTPSAPRSSSIAATFFAYSALVVSFVAPREKPEVSPQAPIAISFFVPSSKRLETFSIGMKGLYFSGGSVVKAIDFAALMTTWSMPAVTLRSGRTALWNLNFGISIGHPPWLMGSGTGGRTRQST